MRLAGQRAARKRLRRRLSRSRHIPETLPLASEDKNESCAFRRRSLLSWDFTHEEEVFAYDSWVRLLFTSLPGTHIQRGNGARKQAVVSTILENRMLRALL